MEPELDIQTKTKLKMPEKDFNLEFEALVEPLKTDQSPDAISDELRVYRMEDRDFYMAIVERIAELTGAKSGREFFSEQA